MFIIFSISFLYLKSLAGKIYMTPVNISNYTDEEEHLEGKNMIHKTQHIIALLTKK